jgi:disulfide bond formation protein DsbB
LSTFFAVLALATAAATVSTWVVVGASLATGQGSWWSEARAALGDLGLWLGGLVALVTMAGSLYYSLVAHFEPCELCWYQRICVYPLSIMLLVAAARRDRGIWRYALAPAVIGVVIAAYHTQLQAFPKQRSFCQATNPCTNRYVWKFGFVSLPLMDLVALCFIITMVVVAATAPTPTEEDLPE